MKKIWFVFLVTFLGFFNANSQVAHVAGASENIELHEFAREKILQWGLNNQQNHRLFTTPRFVRFYNYYFTESFSIKDGQEFSPEMLLIIDVQLYDEQRHETLDVELFDSASGLYIILDSMEKMNQKQIEFGLIDPNQTPESRICNNCD